MMMGWKTWSGALIVIISALSRYFGYLEIADLLLATGTAFGLVGLGHKIEKRR